MKRNIENIRLAAIDALNEEWGSERQIEGENVVCEAAAKLYLDPEDLATEVFRMDSAERVDYCLEILQINLVPWSLRVQAS